MMAGMSFKLWPCLALLAATLAANADAPEPPSAASAPATDLRQRLADRLASPELKLNNPAARGGSPRDRAATRVAKKPVAPPKPWGYVGDVGPERWSELSPDYKLCGQGTRQSPIDLRDTLKVDQEAIQFDYKPAAFSVLDTGRTLLVTPEVGSGLTLAQRRYELRAIEARMPSEMRINGQRFDMSLHLLHRDPEGRLAMLVLLLQRGEQDQPVLQRFWNHLPLEKHQTETVPTPVDLAQLLPAERGYFSFMGSLTTPPCSEGVLWLVMRQPLSVSSQQLAVMHKLYPANARPVQPAGGRLIKESF
jgi:carbonic anhydrase